MRERLIIEAGILPAFLVMDFYQIRAVNLDDVPFLWDMLYEIRSLRYVREGKALPSRDVLQTPDLALIVGN